MDSAGRRNLELRQFTGKERVLGKLRDELAQLSPGYFWFLFPQGRQSQQYLCKRPQVAAVIGSDLELLDSRVLIAVDSGEADDKLLDSRQTSDNAPARGTAAIETKFSLIPTPGGTWYRAIATMAASPDDIAEFGNETLTDGNVCPSKDGALWLSFRNNPPGGT